MAPGPSAVANSFTAWLSSIKAIFGLNFQGDFALNVKDIILHHLWVRWRRPWAVDVWTCVVCPMTELVWMSDPFLRFRIFETLNIWAIWLINIWTIWLINIWSSEYLQVCLIGSLSVWTSEDLYLRPITPLEIWVFKCSSIGTWLKCRVSVGLPPETRGCVAASMTPGRWRPPETSGYRCPIHLRCRQRLVCSPLMARPLLELLVILTKGGREHLRRER